MERGIQASISVGEAGRRGEVIAVLHQAKRFSEQITQMMVPQAIRIEIFGAQLAGTKGGGMILDPPQESGSIEAKLMCLIRVRNEPRKMNKDPQQFAACLGLTAWGGGEA
jgi:hypothetical protein